MWHFFPLELVVNYSLGSLCVLARALAPLSTVRCPPLWPFSGTCFHELKEEEADEAETQCVSIYRLKKINGKGAEKRSPGARTGSNLCASSRDL